MGDDATSHPGTAPAPAPISSPRLRSVLLSLGGLVAAVATTEPVQRRAYSLVIPGVLSNDAHSYTAAHIHLVGPVTLLDALLPAGLFLALAGALGWSKRLQSRTARRAVVAVAVASCVVWLSTLLTGTSTPGTGVIIVFPNPLTTSPAWGALLGVAGSVVAVAGSLVNPAWSPAAPVVTAASVPCPRGHLMPPWFERCSVCRARMPAPAGSQGAAVPAA